MIKKGINVKILVGKDKSKEGEVIEIDRTKNRAKVKGINLVKKHTKTHGGKDAVLVHATASCDLSVIVWGLRGPAYLSGLIHRWPVPPSRCL